MPTIYKRNCDTCGEYYEGGGQLYCSRKCQGASEIFRANISKKKKGNVVNLKHGMSHTRFYEVWKSMRQRCSNPNNKSFKNYGGRGIKVCKRWERFENFYNDMFIEYCEHAYQFGTKNTTIERIDNNGDYCPKNCKWATRIEQINNRRPDFWKSRKRNKLGRFI